VCVCVCVCVLRRASVVMIYSGAYDGLFGVTVPPAYKTRDRTAVFSFGLNVLPLATNDQNFVLCHPILWPRSINDW